jgi:hypothetical protein
LYTAKQENYLKRLLILVNIMKLKKKAGKDHLCPLFMYKLKVKIKDKIQ